MNSLQGREVSAHAKIDEHDLVVIPTYEDIVMLEFCQNEPIVTEDA